MDCIYAPRSTVLNGAYPLWRVNPVNTVVPQGGTAHSLFVCPFDPCVDLLSLSLVLVSLSAEGDLLLGDDLGFVPLFLDFGWNFAGFISIGSAIGVMLSTCVVGMSCWVAFQVVVCVGSPGLGLGCFRFQCVLLALLYGAVQIFAAALLFATVLRWIFYRFSGCSIVCGLVCWAFVSVFSWLAQFGSLYFVSV
ncbi:hypothetical protein RchiOBHm_Chr2g0088501 [Rosa chinensis]|uniref:Transmembrane protein n=1 Tax=Rosa chinensis TaxID=74649 RepID=A0A2P6QHY7_ROSCH|nr:hypothetical protein RchiOBHm_Chr5g0061531 [Rosa chinensis]PRQ46382.1 hypothetical protein RchiOBHm_Chr2g0088501 [Rosa chinensis]